MEWRISLERNKTVIRFSLRQVPVLDYSLFESNCGTPWVHTYLPTCLANVHT